MKILYVASEAAPFIKTGGLADVAGSLPKAIKELGHDIRVVLPLHSTIKQEYKDKMKKVHEYYVDLNWRRQYVGVMELVHDGVTFYFLDNEYYFDRAKVYGEMDDGERYAYFSKAVTILPKEIKFKPKVIHTNDWHSALVNLFIYEFNKGDSYYDNIKKIFTIHNLKYQGVFPPSVLGEVMGVSNEYFNDSSIKFFDNINFMKAGIVYSDVITTVSQSYADEIKYGFFGEGLEGILAYHSQKLVGIVNGIDYEVWNPKIDTHIAYNYDEKSLKTKLRNKKAIQNKYDLPDNKEIPLIAMISRFSDMKGLDLVAHIMDELLQENIQFVVLGTGEAEFENMFKHFEWKYPDKVAANIYFSEDDAHLIYAGADIFLMPSMIEPCGLSQLISLKYGTIPVVREVGGLKDTIIPYNQYTHEGNGFSFRNYNAHELLYQIKEALNIYTTDEKAWESMMVRAMKADHSWKASSKEYLKIYK